MSKAKKVLLVEDDPALGALFVEFLNAHGYEVVWYVRARLENKKALVFETIDGVEFDFDADQNNHDFEVALVDWQLRLSAMQGVEVTQELFLRDITVIACGGTPRFNQELIHAGAKGSIIKYDLSGLSKTEEDPLRALITQAA